jgi:hypothetical protein
MGVFVPSEPRHTLTLNGRLRQTEFLKYPNKFELQLAFVPIQVWNRAPRHRPDVISNAPVTT